MSHVNFDSSGYVSGGFVEGNQAYQDKWGMPINVKPLPLFGGLVIHDGSSPVANFRVEEAFIAMLAMAKTSNLVTVSTNIGCGGTHHAYGSMWGIKPTTNPYWEKFYQKTGIMDRISPEFAPISKGVYTAAYKRKIEILKMWARVAPANKLVHGLNLRVTVFEQEYARMKISSLIPAVADGGVIMTFPCPVCSHQSQETVYHAIRRNGDGIVVTRSDRSPAASGCKGGFPWKEQWENLTVGDATYLLGGRLYGKATYYMTTQTFLKPAIMIRDYSDPRGTVASTVESWSKNVWISPRVYVSNSSGDTTMETFQESIRQYPREWTELIQEFPILGDGQRYDVTY